VTQDGTPCCVLGGEEGKRRHPKILDTVCENDEQESIDFSLQLRDWQQWDGWVSGDIDMQLSICQGRVYKKGGKKYLSLSLPSKKYLISDKKCI